MIVFVFVLAWLATWRLTHLAVEDAFPLVARPRDAIVAGDPNGWLAYLVTCTWCSSVWIGAAVTAGVDLLTRYPVPMPLLYALSLSILTAFAETVVDWLDRYGA